MKPQPETASVVAPAIERQAYVPPKLERLDAGQTELNIIAPITTDGIFFS